MTQIADPRSRTNRRIATIAALFIGGPSAVLVSIGVLILVFGSYTHDYVFGILILSFAAIVVVGSVSTMFYVRREAALARLQTEFLSKVSHDLRTPLTSIRMFVETLQLGRGGDPETVQQCLDTIATETDRLTRLIDRLLGFARMEAGRRVYDLVRQPLRDFIDLAVEAFEAQRLEHPFTLELDVPEELPEAMLDTAGMSEALLNLLQNAHRYTGTDKRIKLSCRVVGDRAEIAVADNGPGIPTAEHRRIFEKFYRSDAARRGQVPGTGLGLTMVKHIAEAHGGTVTVESLPGRGATFTLSVPVLVASPKKPARGSGAPAEG